MFLYMNHELRDTQGIARRHGETGVFVSRWVIDPGRYTYQDGSDDINPGVLYWDYPSGTYVTSGARWADGTLQERTFGGSARTPCPTRASSTTSRRRRATRASSSSPMRRMATSAAPSP